MINKIIRKGIFTMGLSNKDNEKLVNEIFKVGTCFIFDNLKYEVIKSGKPRPEGGGECKTDIYILAKNQNGANKEFKISYKQPNSDYIENWLKPEIAENLLGVDWKRIIIQHTTELKSSFYSKSLIYRDKNRRTEEGSMTLGWAYHLVDKKSGNFISEMKLTKPQVYAIYAGTNLSKKKKNSFVNHHKIPNSGVANYVLRTLDLNSPQEIIDNLKTIDEYIKLHPKVYNKFQAVNYRTYADKFERNRSLSVYVEWMIQNNKITTCLNFDDPLENTSNDVEIRLSQVMSKSQLKTTKDIDNSMMADSAIIFEKAKKN